MRIYAPVPAEGHEFVVPLTWQDSEMVAAMGETPLATTWTPIPVQLVTDDDEGVRLATSDFPWLGSDALVLRERAAKLLGPFVDGEAELLPLSCDGTELWLLHVLRIIDALDESRSEVVRSSSGRIMMVRRYVFRPEVVGEACIFKVPQLTRSAHFVTQAFVETVQSAGLRGLDFELRWTSEARE